MKTCPETPCHITQEELNLNVYATDDGYMVIRQDGSSMAAIAPPDFARLASCNLIYLS